MMKIFKVLTLAVAVMAGSSAWAKMANSMEVKFPRGADQTALVGTISGHDYDSYRFWAKKGQHLSINLHGSDPQIRTALFFKNKLNGSTAKSMTLPATGTYELRVLQSANDARKSRADRQYNLVLKIQNRKPKFSSWVHYSCDDAGRIRVQYKDVNTQSPKVTVNYRGQNYHLRYNDRYSRAGDILFLTSRNGLYSLNVDISHMQDVHDFKRSEIITFTKRRKGTDAVVVQNCLPR